MILVFWLLIGQLSALLWSVERSCYIMGIVFLLLFLLVGAGCVFVSRFSYDLVYVMIFLTLSEIIFLLKKQKHVTHKREIDFGRPLDALYPNFCLCFSLIVFTALTMSFIKLMR